MPVILGDEDIAKWLGKEPAANDAITALLRPFDAARITAWRVAKAVGNVRNKSTTLVDAVAI